MRQKSLLELWSPPKRKKEDEPAAEPSKKQKFTFEEEIENSSASDTEEMDMSIVDLSIRSVAKKNSPLNSSKQLQTPWNRNRANDMRSSNNNNSANTSEKKREARKPDWSDGDVSNVIHWSWCGNDGVWIDYADDVNLRIETAYQNKDPVVSVDSERSVEFMDMIQRRNDDIVKTKARKVKRTVNGVDDERKPSWISRTGSGRVLLQKEGSLVSKGRWHWKADDGIMMPMDAIVNGILEEAYRQGVKQVKIDAERFVNLETMTQHRIDNPNKIRKVQREEDKSVSQERKLVTKSTNIISIDAEWSWENEDGRWIPYDGNVSRKLEDSYVRGNKSEKVKLGEDTFVDLKHMMQVGKSMSVHVKRVIPEQQMKNLNEMTGGLPPPTKSRMKSPAISPKKPEVKSNKSPINNNNSISGLKLTSSLNGSAKFTTPSGKKKIIMDDSTESDEDITLLVGDEELNAALKKPNNSPKHSESTITMTSEIDLTKSQSFAGEPDEDETESMEEDQKAKFPSEAELRKNKRLQYKCGDNFTVLSKVDTWTESLAQINVGTLEEGAYERRADINDKVSLWVGDMTKIEIDAIVNAAKPSLLGGGGIDGAIHKAAGSSLLLECMNLGGCDPGQARITGGYRLPASHIIHTVGPISRKPKILESCYKSVLAKMLKHNLRSLAFCCVSTGIYGYPNDEAAEIALSVTRKWLEEDNNYQKIDRVIFCIFDVQADLRIYKRLMAKKYFPPPITEIEIDDT